MSVGVNINPFLCQYTNNQSTIEGYEPGEVGAILDQALDIKVRTGLHYAPAAHRTLGIFPLGTIRLSPGYLNTTAEVTTTLAAVEKIARTKPARGLAKTRSPLETF